MLVNPGTARAETNVREAEAAARAIELQIDVFNATTPMEINVTFATRAREPSDALFVSLDPFFTVRRVQLANMAASLMLPTS